LLTWDRTKPTATLPQYAPLLERGGQRQVEPVRLADYNWFNFFETPPTGACLRASSPRGYGQQSVGDHFFSYTDMPNVDFVEMDYGMKS